MNNLLKGAAFFIGGALVGATAALLLTPKTGEEVRNEISDLACEAKKRAQECCDQVKEQIETRFSKAAKAEEPVKEA